MVENYKVFNDIYQDCCVTDFCESVLSRRFNESKDTTFDKMLEAYDLTHEDLRDYLLYESTNNKVANLFTKIINKVVSIAGSNIVVKISSILSIVGTIAVTLHIPGGKLLRNISAVARLTTALCQVMSSEEYKQARENKDKKTCAKLLKRPLVTVGLRVIAMFLVPILVNALFPKFTINSATTALKLSNDMTPINKINKNDILKGINLAKKTSTTI